MGRNIIVFVSQDFDRVNSRNSKTRKAKHEKMDKRQKSKLCPLNPTLFITSACLLPRLGSQLLSRGAIVQPQILS